MKKKNKLGFTLIELLVVVLIIGILAAVALPQYRKAVGKAELAQVISATKAIQNAQERYYLAQGTYGKNGLDIDIPDTYVKCAISANYSICYNRNYVIAHYYSLHDTRANRLECYAKSKNMLFPCEEFLQHKGGYAKQGPCNNLGMSSCWTVSKIMPM